LSPASLAPGSVSVSWYCLGNQLIMRFLSLSRRDQEDRRSCRCALLSPALDCMYIGERGF
jgi:hypothetical protein